MLGGGPRRDLRGCGVPGKGPPGGPGWPECLPLKRTLGKAAAHLHIEPRSLSENTSSRKPALMPHAGLPQTP